MFVDEIPKIDWTKSKALELATVTYAIDTFNGSQPVATFQPKSYNRK